jgi:hypothetical protein
VAGFSGVNGRTDSRGQLAKSRFCNSQQFERHLRSLWDLPLSTSSKTANADVKGNSDGKQGGRWPRMPVKSRNGLDLELVPARENLSEWDWSDKEQIQGQTEY